MTGAVIIRNAPVSGIVYVNMRNITIRREGFKSLGVHNKLIQAFEREYPQYHVFAVFDDEVKTK